MVVTNDNMKTIHTKTWKCEHCGHQRDTILSLCPYCGNQMTLETDTEKMGTITMLEVEDLDTYEVTDGITQQNRLLTTIEKEEMTADIEKAIITQYKDVIIE